MVNGGVESISGDTQRGCRTSEKKAEMARNVSQPELVKYIAGVAPGPLTILFLLRTVRRP